MSRIEKALTIVRNKGVSGAAKMLRRRYTAAPKVQSRRAAALVRKSMDRAVLDAQREHKFKNNPLISILMPVYNTDIDMLCCVIESVMAQTYPVWELCICDASDGAHALVGDKCREYEAADSGCRIKYRRNFFIIDYTLNLFTVFFAVRNSYLKFCGWKIIVEIGA